MTVLIHVNEASVSAVSSREASDEVAACFVGVLREIRRRRGDAVLMSGISLQDVVFYEHYALSEWGRRDANRDRWRLVRRMQDKSPGWDYGLKGVFEYRVGGLSVSSLGHAHMSGGLLLSFATSAQWAHDIVAAERHYLQESAGGEAVIEVENVEVRHASTSSHLESHLDWITRAGLERFESGPDLLSKCDEAFPQITLLERAKEQLRRLDPKWIAPVVKEFALINRALLEWKPEAPFPYWYTKITPESQRRLDRGLVDFTDSDGVVRSFSTHARLTPDEGRIHFRVIKDSKSAVVAHVGAKIL